LHAGSVPDYAYFDSLGQTHQDWRAQWNFRIWGLVEAPWQCNYHEFIALQRVEVLADMHCVTRWSKLDNVWEGVSTRTVLSKVKVLPEAMYVMVHSEQAYTTNLPMDDFLGEDCLFAWKHNGQPLEPDHGYPLRLVVPGWVGSASTKWLHTLTVLDAPFKGTYMDSSYRVPPRPIEPGTKMPPDAVSAEAWPIKSIITSPAPGAHLKLSGAGPVVVRGRAWVGEGAVDRVVETGQIFEKPDERHPVVEVQRPGELAALALVRLSLTGISSGDQQVPVGPRWKIRQRAQ
jgi:DMSO/TMAO reductase YedYZ molybdopterin-dependent catalytic subunit